MEVGLKYKLNNTYMSINYRSTLMVVWPRIPSNLYAPSEWKTNKCITREKTIIIWSLYINNGTTRL